MSLFAKQFDELELESEKTEMLKEVKPLYGFGRGKNRYLINKIVKEMKADIYSVADGDRYIDKNFDKK